MCGNVFFSVWTTPYVIPPSGVLKEIKWKWNVWPQICLVFSFGWKMLTSMKYAPRFISLERFCPYKRFVQEFSSTFGRTAESRDRQTDIHTDTQTDQNFRVSFAQERLSSLIKGSLCAPCGRARGSRGAFQKLRRRETCVSQASVTFKKRGWLSMASAWLWNEDLCFLRLGVNELSMVLSGGAWGVHVFGRNLHLMVQRFACLLFCLSCRCNGPLFGKGEPATIRPACHMDTYKLYFRPAFAPRRVAERELTAECELAE